MPRAWPAALTTVATVAAVALGVAFAGREARTPGAGAPAASAGPAAFPEGTAGARLSEYVAGDFAGERLERASWLKYQRFVMWRTEAAWDQAYVVRSFKLEKVASGPTEASAEVHYDTLGVLDLATFAYETSPTRQAVPFQLLLSEGAWKIGLPMLRPHPGPEAACAFLTRMRTHFVRQRPTIDQAIVAIRRDAARPAP